MIEGIPRKIQGGSSQKAVREAQKRFFLVRPERDPGIHDEKEAFPLKEQSEAYRKPFQRILRLSVSF